MGRRPRLPAIVPPPPAVKSRKHARRLTSEYHRITERLHRAVSPEEREQCTAELDAMGGVDAYQRASVFNTALHSTSRWVARRLRARGIAGIGEEEPRVLEIGAINTQLLRTPGLRVRAIDLNSQDPMIEEQDFLKLPHGGEIDVTTGLSRPYDALVCSMVLNCVPDARMRFDFLISMRSQLREGGVAFVVLPRSCLAHSRTLTHDSFLDCLRAVGLLPDMTQKAPESNKLVYFECIAGLPDEKAALRFQKTRHDMRSTHATRRKSRGAEFDVDVGGHLGFGVRIARSYIPEVLSRGKREQQMAREEFLLQQGEGHIADAPSDNEVSRSRDGSPMTAQRDAGMPSHAAAETSEDLLVDYVAKKFKGRLDYAKWQWNFAALPQEPSVGVPVGGGWSFAPQRSSATTQPSLQAASGWQWTGDGWRHTTFRTTEEMIEANETKEHENARALNGKVISRSSNAVRPIARGRLQLARTRRATFGSSWRHKYLPKNLGVACWWYWA